MVIISTTEWRLSNEAIKKHSHREGNGTSELSDAGLPKHGRHSVEAEKAVCRNNRTDAGSRDGRAFRIRKAQY